MKHIYKKILVLFLVFSFTFSPILALKAEAQWTVFDPANFAVNSARTTKDLGLDGIAWMVVNLIIERMSASVINWINNGFSGGPGFVTNPESYFKDIGDKIAGQYILDNPNLNFLCGPISAKIRLALAKSYINEPTWQCTLTEVGKNMENFMSDFSNGGWDSFFELTQRQQNNPIGAFLQAENELNLRIATRQGTLQKELDWGNGFLSFKTCEGGRITNSEADKQYIDSGYSVGDCLGGETISTPGGVIQTQLNKQLGLGQDKLAVADEINEIISALLNQLIGKILGGIGGGLRGTSQKSPTNNNQSLVDQLLNSTASSTVDYFGNSQDLRLMDVPVPGTPGSSTATPLDNDCTSFSFDELTSMAQTRANSTGVSFDEAMTNLDCGPLGIH